MDLKSIAMLCACAALVVSIASMDQKVDFENSFLFSKNSPSVQKSLDIAAIYDNAQADTAESLANIAPAAGGNGQENDEESREKRLPNFTPFGKVTFDNKHSWMYGGAPK